MFHLPGNGLPIIIHISLQQILNIPVTFIRVPYHFDFLITYGVCKKRKYCNRINAKKVSS